jgi:UDP-2,3-diacylglucosamine hydrolase
VDLIAPNHWRQVDFISDLHLHAAEPGTHDAWVRYMQSTTADALFILGDVFEVWVGDDTLDDPESFEAACARIIRHTSERMSVFIMRGNRDFLIGERLAQACNAQLLEDPSTFQFLDTRIVLTHGDALCLDDVAYQAFRNTVRSADWQQEFLEKPLAERQQIAADIRARSEHQKTQHENYADVDPAAAVAVLQQLSAKVMVHGHTHRPATHTLPDGNIRWVLSDWHVHGGHARAEVLRLQTDETNQTPRWTRISPDEASLRPSPPGG